MNCFVFYLAERPSFYQYLEGQNLAVNTVNSYCWTADFFKSHFGRFGRKSLADYKSFLLENFKPKTVNLRIQGINKYLDYAGKSKNSESRMSRCSKRVFLKMSSAMPITDS